MEPWRFCRPVAADSPHFDEEQETNPFQSEKLDPDLFKIKRWIRIRLEVMRINNPYRGAHNKMRSGSSRFGMSTLPTGITVVTVREQSRKDKKTILKCHKGIKYGTWYRYLRHSHLFKHFF
jgi:hypothetical protein